jgi:arginyl-tRNA--protein-N-Asp/Glu arginylyltransferase
LPDRSQMANKSVLSSNAFMETFPCPYFRDGRETSVEYIVADAFSGKEFDTILSKGYRRIGRVFYRNVCSRCSACKPIRIEVEKFSPGKSGRRTVKKNDDLLVRVASFPEVTPEKRSLYEHYVSSKHGEPVDAPDSTVPALYALHYGYERIIEMNYFEGETLIGVGIADEGEDSLSSNYFYYDTDYLDRRPGVFSILQEIVLAKRMGKRYYYLGFYIADNSAMSYKKDFRPNQIFEDDAWIEFLS